MKYRNTANRVLAGSFLLFILSSVLKYLYGSMLIIELFHSVTQAAVVGGVADWFAVTALFKRPLGFPWHTELISRHRMRVIQSITEMIEKELLSVEAVKSRIGKVCFVELCIDWVENKNGKLFLKSLIHKYSHEALTAINVEAVALYVGGTCRDRLKEMEVVPLLQKILTWTVENKKYEQAVSFIIHEGILRIEKSNTREFIYRKLLEVKEQNTKSVLEKAIFWLGEQTNSVNLSEAADVIYEEVLALLYEAKDKDHIIYRWLYDSLVQIGNNLDGQTPWAEVLESWKMTMIEKTDLTEVLEKVAHAMLEAARKSEDSPIVMWLWEQAQKYWSGFIQNQQAKDWLESGIKQTVNQLIEKEHPLIGEIVHNVLEGFSDKDLNQFIEDKAGDDLQWIRINGSLVGAGVGFVLFLFLHFVYEPFVLSAVQDVFR